MYNNEINATQAVAAGASPVSLFENPEFGSVRIIVKENGEPLFCLRDVCSCLSLDDTGKVAGRIDQDELTRLQVVSGGQTREMIFTTEPGLYDVILGARSNERTKPFRKWVTSEVLPSIRKTETSEITSCISKDSVSEITVVNFLGRDIHVLGTPEDPLFIAKDVAEWIGQSDVSSMCRVLEDHDTEKVRIMAKYGSDGSMRVKEVLVITEQGLYKILWRSNKPEAQKFASKHL